MKWLFAILAHLIRWAFGVVVIALIDVAFAPVLREWTAGFLYGVWGIWTVCCLLCAALKCDRK
jgi:hypothetical protein